MIRILWVLWGCADDAKEVRESCPPSPWASVEVGYWAACGVHEDGCAVCWGDGVEDDTYYGRTFDILAVPGDRRYAEITMAPSEACGVPEFACGITLDGEVVCWGQRYEVNNPTVAMSLPAVDLAVGECRVCAIDTAGALVCSGHNQEDFPEGAFSEVEVGVQGPEWDSYPWCGVDLSGEVQCWGEYLPPTLLGPGPFETISMASSICGIRGTGELECNWVRGSVLGGDERFVAVSAGGDGDCALTTEGEVRCFHAGSTPTTDGVPSGTFKSLSSGYRSACAVSTDGELVCWGADFNGLLDHP